jgi:hypothetical protein
MKRQLNDSNERFPSKCLIKNSKSTFYSLNLTNEYCVYWFDEVYNDLLKHYHTDQSRLRGIIDYLQIFNEFNQCETAIRENIGIKMFIIVNASNCMKFLTLFNDLREVHSIYTYKDNNSIDYSFVNECKTFIKVSL